MKHVAASSFWSHYRGRPADVQRIADENLKIRDDLWSVRVGRSYRALATMEAGDYVWFWIVHHRVYDRLIR